MSDIKEYEDKMKKSVDSLKEDYTTIRAGRANPHILDKIKVVQLVIIALWLPLFILEGNYVGKEI